MPWLVFLKFIFNVILYRILFKKLKKILIARIIKESDLFCGNHI